MKDLWNAADVPDQKDRVAVITGGGTGLGYQIALVLVSRGAHAVLAVRDVTKAKRPPNGYSRFTRRPRFRCKS